MKYRLFAAAVALFAAAALPMAGATSLLTPDGVRYTLEETPNEPHVQVIRSQGDTRVRLIVPTTQDAIVESQAQLGYDSATDTLFVVWSREANGVGEIRYATFSSAGHWSPARLITAGATRYRGLQFVLTHAESLGDHATLLHAAWWSINGAILEPEYAMFAFENMRLISADVHNLDDFAAAGGGTYEASSGSQPAGMAHPPMALDRNGSSVDVVFGKVNSTKVNLLNIVPRKVGGDVRIWKPLGRKITRTPGSGLISSTSVPVQAYMNNGHLALYTIDDELRFVVLRKNGAWSPVRSLRIDDHNNAADLQRELEKTVEELLDEEAEAEEEAIR